MVQFSNDQITVFESALFRTTSSLVQTADLILVVDPNWLPAEVAEIRNAFDQIKDHRPAWLLFTHSDYDHIIGRMAFADLPVIASKAFQDNPGKAKTVQQILDFDDEYYITRSYPIQYPEVDVVVESDGQQFIVGDTSLRFHHAPGHNSDGIFTVFEKEGIWLAGDYLSNIEFPYIYHNSYDYEEALQKATNILNGPIRLLVPGHGDVTQDKKEMQNRIEESRAYINKLRKSLSEGKAFDLEALWRRYQFPKVMGRFHEGNETLVKQELEA